MATSKLVLVESPAKAKTIQRFLADGTLVKATFGHIRDLPKSRLGVDVADNFKPEYVIPKKAGPIVRELKALARRAQSVYLATDPDREGEAIAWHASLALDLPKEKIHRILFHEITPAAITRALEKPSTINEGLVHAQQARRVLDRLVGYSLSPLLWKKIYRGLSAGRVQSVALRLITDRESDIVAFKAKEYWSIWAVFTTVRQASFSAKLTSIAGKDVSKQPSHAQIAPAEKLGPSDGWVILDRAVEQKQRHPKPPFTTSTLQQVAGRQLRFSVKQTMMLAQALYEGVDIGGETAGLITYMRTDSFNLAATAVEEVRKRIVKSFGAEYLPESPRRYKTKSKGAQEAHEAIRPTSVNYLPENVKRYLTPQQYKLYDLIWRRTMACQMASADLEATRLSVSLERDHAAVVYTAHGIRVLFPGFTRIYEEERDESSSHGESSEGDDSTQILPEVAIGDPVVLDKMAPKQHFTQPPPRYTEASLVQELERLGIGRPSTYAPTISTIQDRGYVTKDQGKFMPQEVGGIVIKLLREHFPDIIDYDFTAGMEKDLDKIAAGQKKWVEVVRAFYQPFSALVEKAQKTVDKKSLVETATDEKCPECGKQLMNKFGRYGRFLACTGFPECRYTRPVNMDEKTREKQEALVEGRHCPNDKGELIIRTGRFGSFIGCINYPKCDYVETIIKEIGVVCPDDGGQIIERRSRRGKIFWGCSNYPKCHFASWDKPLNQTCPTCHKMMVERRGQAVCRQCAQSLGDTEAPKKRRSVPVGRRQRSQK